ncbi:unnamed protein product [Ranitomeya imitator]|uniref:Uncharacterized protein n=1 Tax=Ranitomeya imitator TaxID=111125 RepID=A0ABN9MIR6_9NEOB|nr:unnamed protein product [Ranitomeya imitator]
MALSSAVQAAGSGAKDAVREGPAMTSWSCDRDVLTGPALIPTLGPEAAACTAHRCQDYKGPSEGNHILPDEDLAAFHWSLLGPDHPLASLKVRAHQLVLPPCDVVIKAVADYVRNIKDTNDLDSISSDVFQHSQSRTDDKVPVSREQSHITEPPTSPCRTQLLTLADRIEVPGKAPHMSVPCGTPHKGPYLYNLSESTAAISPTNKSVCEQNNYSNIPHEGKHTPLYERSSPINPAQSGSPNHVDSAYFPPSSASSSSDNDDGNGGATNHISGTKCDWDKKGKSLGKTKKDATDQAKTENPSPAQSASKATDKKVNQGTLQIPCLLSMPTRNHMDITTPPLPLVAPEVLRVAEHRHKKGLMSLDFQQQKRSK